MDPHTSTRADREKASVPVPNSALANQASQQLKALRKAISTKDAEAISNAYLTLREHARSISPKTLLDLLDRTIAPNTSKMLAHAFSRRGCYLCDSGVVDCDHCNGTGFLEEDRICPRCDGVMVEPCGFCGGTGWADMTSLPVEMRRDVLKRHLVRVQKEIRRIASAISKFSRDKLNALPDPQRRMLATQLISMRARLIELVKTEAVTDPEQSKRFNMLAEKLELCLDLLRRETPVAPPENTEQTAETSP